MWNDVKQNKTGDSDKPEVNYLSLNEGITQIRIIDEEPFSRWSHWLQTANGGKGLSVNCPGKGCPVCAVIKATPKGAVKQYSSRKIHSVNVINRANGNVEILEKGNSLFEQLLGLYEEIGDLRGYDIKIKTTGSGKDVSYVAIPMAAKPLTNEEKALVKYNFDEIYTPLTTEQITALMGGASYKDIFGDKEETNEEVKAEDKPEVDFTQSN